MDAAVRTHRREGKERGAIVTELGEVPRDTPSIVKCILAYHDIS